MSLRIYANHVHKDFQKSIKFKSLIKSSGPNPSAAVAIDESTKYLVSAVLIAVLDLKFGFHAGESSITNIFSMH